MPQNAPWNLDEKQGELCQSIPSDKFPANNFTAIFQFSIESTLNTKNFGQFKFQTKDCPKFKLSEISKCEI